MLRRDDPAAAPWTDDGKRRIQELGLSMQVSNYVFVTNDCYLVWSV